LRYGHQPGHWLAPWRRQDRLDVPGEQCGLRVGLAATNQEGLELDRIFLGGMEAPCIIGIYDWEREIPQTVRIDLELATDVLSAARADDIEAATDYKSISKCVLQLVRESSYGLIETLAEEIARTCLRESSVSWVRVRLAKPGALRGARDVGIEIERGALPPDGAAHLIYLGLGSNVDAERSVVEAVDWVRRRFRLLRLSSVYEGPASGGPPGQPDFLNLVLECRTGLDPFGVQAELRAIEARMGRVRGADAYAPRRCDLDLLLFDDLCGERLGVNLPHPQIISEAFVHVPLLELAPDLHHPESRRRLADVVQEPGKMPHGMRIRDDLSP